MIENSFPHENGEIEKNRENTKNYDDHKEGNRGDRENSDDGNNDENIEDKSNRHRDGWLHHKTVREDSCGCWLDLLTSTTPAALPQCVKMKHIKYVSCF